MITNKQIQKLGLEDIIEYFENILSVSEKLGTNSAIKLYEAMSKRQCSQFRKWLEDYEPDLIDKKNVDNILNVIDSL